MSDVSIDFIFQTLYINIFLFQTANISINCKRLFTVISIPFRSARNSIKNNLPPTKQYATIFLIFYEICKH